MPVIVASWIIVVQGLITMFMVIRGGLLGERFSYNELLIGSSLLISLGTGMLAETTNVGLFLAGTVIFGLGTGLLTLSDLMGICTVNGEKGKIAALISFSLGLGSSSVGPVIGGFVGEVAGIQTALWTMVPAFVLFAACLIVHRWRKSYLQGDTIAR